MSDFENTELRIVLLGHEWREGDAFTRHDRHQQHAACAICRGDVDAVLAVVTPRIRARLETQAQQEEDAYTKRVLENTMFEGMNPDGHGGVVVKLRMAAELSMGMVTAFKTYLDQAGAENYVEQTVIDRETGDQYLVTIQRPRGKTPHQLRRAAEAELAKLRETVAQEIEDRLVCCDIFGRLEAIAQHTPVKTLFDQYRQLRGSSDFHGACYYGGWAAAIARSGNAEMEREGR